MNDQAKLLAVIAAAVLIGSQYLPQIVSMLRKAWASLPSMQRKDTEIGPNDLALVLDLANRLRVDGNEKAAVAAKQLLDAMLSVSEVKKK